MITRREFIEDLRRQRWGTAALKPARPKRTPEGKGPNACIFLWPLGGGRRPHGHVSNPKMRGDGKKKPRPPTTTRSQTAIPGARPFCEQPGPNGAAARTAACLIRLADSRHFPAEHAAGRRTWLAHRPHAPAARSSIHPSASIVLA